MIGGNGYAFPTSDDGGGDTGGEHRPERRLPASRKYSAAVALVMISILMLFLVLTAAFVFLRVQNLHSWASIRMPGILWINTAVLLASSATLEMARRKLRVERVGGFKRMWMLTTALGVLFVGGQFIAWRQLAEQGVYLTSRLASSFFYVFTALHAAHVLGGICALLYVGFRKFETSRVSRPAAAEVASYYWHFMDGLWLLLLALLYFGQ